MKRIISDLEKGVAVITSVTWIEAVVIPSAVNMLVLSIVRIK
jgi:hypothetical protein